MKKCEYCGSEISYYDQYCNDECQLKANKYYELVERFGKLFSVINMICVFGIPIGLFIFSFSKAVGLCLSVGSCAVLGIMLLVLPFPTESMIKKYKIQNAVKKTKIFGVMLLGLGLLIAIFAVIFVK